MMMRLGLRIFLFDMLSGYLRLSILSVLIGSFLLVGSYPYLVIAKTTSTAVKSSAVTKKAADYIQSTDVPKVVSDLFLQVFKKKINTAESNYWKGRARIDKNSVSALKGAMVYQKSKGGTMPASLVAKVTKPVQQIQNIPFTPISNLYTPLPYLSNLYNGSYPSSGLFPLITPTPIAPINILGSGSCNRIGNTSYCSDGSTYNQIGNTVYGPGGSTYTKIGNSIYGPGGSTYTTIGNTTYGPGGSMYTRIGNTLYGPNGSTYTTIGNTTYGNPGF